MRCGTHVLVVTPLLKPPRKRTQETAMKRVMCTVAIAPSMLGSANFALAQSYPDMGANTGSEANRAAHEHGGEYFGEQ
jgi:hypothetical protein